MKIGILTLPVGRNYGGIIQCYALFKILRDSGHDPYLISRDEIRTHVISSFLLYYLKHFVKLIIGRQSSWHYRISDKQDAFVFEEPIKFINSHIKPRTIFFKDRQDALSKIRNLDIKAVIVGSDQVWRRGYTSHIDDFFLDFLDGDTNISRIAYAASFGIEEWQFSGEKETKYYKLVHQFKAISVREKSAVSLCQDHWDIDAKFVLDPTLLLSASDYRKIESKSDLEPRIFCYILDRNDEKERIIKSISSHYKLNDFEIMPKSAYNKENIHKDIISCKYAPVEDWISAFDSSDYVITDSYHGVIFSIIFHKEFWVIKNKSRGVARFDSILSLFNLEDRVIDMSNRSEINYNLHIDWRRVDAKLESMKSESLQFLDSALR